MVLGYRDDKLLSEDIYVMRRADGILFMNNWS